ncbi:uncharacterized protein MONBRDRAFT_28049 [Monosiga brevicollis MX1]|uniref:Peptidase S53 domain-containing protein n=1 Tax=Monosiga brevicollis TaxID=81824 RepID=A9V718_MONBE|nr:uncharacterized protein MONBRDRAFT_28049 [Monosiga brevicollis MX1]EDQ86643.1 predicted protein [Monosiga brevicollis MX1]|eukprot:XP_001748479.1 hypothetical protein [Monosiga brevicollis MX1]
MAGMVTPAVLKTLYNITDTVSNSTGASQACAEFQQQDYSPEDLEAFQNYFGLPIQKVRNVSSDGAGIAHDEANLDIQYLMGVAPGMPSDFWIQAGETFDVLAWATYVLNTQGTAQVWSVSYGEDIETAVRTFDATYPRRFNTELQKLATLGHTILFASGDSGVYSRNGFGADFRPDFPASLPAVTGVGATQLEGDGTEKQGTSFSGGGFCLSQYFNRSADCPYQQEAVASFFSDSTNLPPSNLYDANGCGYPDVSAQGVNFEVYVDKIRQPVSGTSASCPTVAAIVALLNDQRLQAGKPPLGNINQLIYQNPGAFNDITEGFNHGSGFHGFHAIAGWDPVTGMGTPNYPAWKKAVLA